MRQNLIGILTVIIFSLPVVLPIFRPYVSGTADGLGHRFRLVSFFHSLQEGNIKPRWASEAALGYGAPTFLFNYPLPYYLASVFVFLGFSINESGQLLAAFALIISAVLMFLAVKNIAGRIAGLTAAAVYLYAPYHLLITYLYDAWGEMLAFVFPPLLLLLLVKLHQAYQAKTADLKRYFILLTLCWIFFVIGHNLSMIMLSPIILAASFLVGRNNWRFVLLVINIFVLVIGISTFFLLPAISLQHEIKYPKFLESEMIYLGNFAKSVRFQLQTAAKLYIKDKATYWDFTVGAPVMLGFLFSLKNIIFSKKTKMLLDRFKPNKNKSKLRKEDLNDSQKKNDFFHWQVVMVIIFLLCLYLTNYASRFFWRFPPFTHILEPYRFIFPASFVGALLLGILARKNVIFACVVVLLSFFQARPFANPAVDTFPFPKNYFYQTQTVSSAPQTRKNMIIKEFLPVLASYSFLAKEEDKYYQYLFQGKKYSKAELFLSSGEGEVANIRSQSEKLTADILAKTAVIVTINRFYFPNWQITVNGKKLYLRKDLDGRMLIDLPPGNFHLSLVFGLTPVEKTANLLSICSIIIFFTETIYFHPDIFFDFFIKSKAFLLLKRKYFI